MFGDLQMQINDMRYMARIFPALENARKPFKDLIMDVHNYHILDEHDEIFSGIFPNMDTKEQPSRYWHVDHCQYMMIPKENITKAISPSTEIDTSALILKARPFELYNGTDKHFELSYVLKKPNYCPVPINIYLREDRPKSFVIETNESLRNETAYWTPKQRLVEKPPLQILSTQHNWIVYCYTGKIKIAENNEEQCKNVVYKIDKPEVSEIDGKKS